MNKPKTRRVARDRSSSQETAEGALTVTPDHPDLT
jgi:hypothetical protein